MRPDQVVIFSDTSSMAGGAEAMALLSANVMADAGIPVIFIAGDDAGKCPLDHPGIEVIGLGGSALMARHRLRAGIDGLHNAAVKRYVRRFVAGRDTPRTVYHVHNWSQILSPSLFSALRPVADRMFLSAHDFALACPNLSYANFQKAGAVCSLTPLSAACIATHCDRRSYHHKLWRVARSAMLRAVLDFTRTRPLVGIIHPAMSEWYERGGIPKDRIRVVRNPVKPFRQDRVTAERNRDIFFIGRLAYEKGPDLAADAARLAGRRLRVIGDGDMRPVMRARYPEAVLEGWKNHAEIGELLKDARAVIVPSRLPETFTLVAHEALRSGVPVISFSDVDAVEMAERGGAVVVPPREASSLAEALRMLDDDALVERMSRIAFAEGWRFSNTERTWRDSLLDCYAELLLQAAAAPAASPRLLPAEADAAQVNAE
jgi:glycosyltransferase involved in cell wall biosynthesis